MYKKMMLLLPILLSLHIPFYAVVAYTPQGVRECINTVYQATDRSSRKQALEELYAAIKENRMLTSDIIACQAVEQAIESIRALDGDHSAIIDYLEKYLSQLHDRGILLMLEGKASRKRSWSLGLVERCMEDQQAYDLLRLSNELSTNLTLCGCIDSNFYALLKKAKPNPMSDPAVNFKPTDMTNSQSPLPICMGGTGVGCPVVNAWELVPSNMPQFPVNMQFYLPGDLAKNKPVTLELGLLIPYNDLESGHVNIQVLSKYSNPKHSFDIDDVNWTHINTSGNVKITESSTPGNLKYITVQIPLKSSKVKPEAFALLSVSRVAPTGSKSEYNGDLCLVSAVYRYTAE